MHSFPKMNLRRMLVGGFALPDQKCLLERLRNKNTNQGIKYYAIIELGIGPKGETQATFDQGWYSKGLPRTRANYIKSPATFINYQNKQVTMTMWDAYIDQADRLLRALGI